MYGRDYAGETVRFEASGGLVASALIMRDKETDSYWSIMKGEAVGGKLEGEELVELPVSEKIQWRHWKRKHPDTLVLSVNGREDGPDAYRNYFQSQEGFAGEDTSGDGVATKEPVFAFHHGGTPYAVRHEDVEEGRALKLDGGEQVFLYRRRGESKFRSTHSFVSSAGFELRDGTWVERATGSAFDPETGEFRGGAVAPLPGFDTFWYTFRLSNPATRLLGSDEPDPR